MRGPTRSSHRPPTTVPNPRNASATVKFNDTWVSVQCWLDTSGLTNTLHPYTAPRHTCMSTAATAINQRLGSDLSGMSLLAVHCLPTFEAGRSLNEGQPLAMVGRKTRLHKISITFARTAVSQHPASHL